MFPCLKRGPHTCVSGGLSVTYDFVNLAVSRASFNPRMRLKKHPIPSWVTTGCFPFPRVVFLCGDPPVARGSCSHHDDRVN